MDSQRPLSVNISTPTTRHNLDITGLVRKISSLKWADIRQTYTMYQTEEDTKAAAAAGKKIKMLISI